MEEHMNIVVATDGSESAIDAARRAIDLLRTDAQAVLVTVIPEYEDPQNDAGGFEGPVISDKEAAEDWKKATRRGTIRSRSDGGGART
jgi:nucleotide-binding universal stress UspA family protein